MDISKGNFASSVGEICSLIEKSSFFAIDLEMSGISSPSFSETPLDTPEQSYLAKRDAAKRYSIIQVGLCLFEEDHQNDNSSSFSEMSDSSSSSSSSSTETPSFLRSKKSNEGNSISQHNANTNSKLRLIARPFNFFVFPSGAPGGSNDLSSIFPPRDVVISADAASFLRNHGMDWTRWINSGVSYCNRVEMIEARDKLWKRREEEKAAAPRIAREARALLSDEQRAWLDAALVTASSFGSDSKLVGGAECVLPPIRNSPSCVALRAAIHADPSLAATLTVSFRGKRGHHDCLLARRHLTPEEETSKLVLDAVGFTTIFQKMISQRKPIIGHNCFADWCFMMESFYEPLPPNLSQFKDQMRAVAPSVFDTKILSQGGCSHYPDHYPMLISPGTFESTHLEGLFRAFGGLSSSNSGSRNNSNSVSSRNNNNSNNTSNNNNNKNNNVNSESLLEISLPLGFQNYDTKSTKGHSAHEAGFDSLMTGAVFGHFLTRYASSPLIDNGENKLALYRSLYSVDLNSSSNSSSGVGGNFDNVFLPGRHEMLHIQPNFMKNNANTTTNKNIGSSAGSSFRASSSPIENALRTCCENVSFFYSNINSSQNNNKESVAAGGNEMIACIGKGPIEDRGDLNVPQQVQKVVAVGGNTTTTNSSRNNNNSNLQQQQESKQQQTENNNNKNNNTILFQRPKAINIVQLNERIQEFQKQQQQQISENINNKTNRPQHSFTDSPALSVLANTTRTHILPPHLSWWFSSSSSSTTYSDNNQNNTNNSKIIPVPQGATKGFEPSPPKFSMTEFRDRDFKSLFRSVVSRRR